MKKDVCLLATLTLALTGCTEPSADAPSTRAPSVGTQRSAIVGGTPDMTHVAVFDILVEREQSCSGTLISPHLVLTAAHCIVEDVDDATELEVFTGFDESKLNEGKIHKVVAGPIHPKYDPRSGKEDGDLAVLVLAEPSTVKPMRYNKKPLQQSHIGAPAIMIGYGDTTIREPTSGGGRRLQATSPLISFDQNWVVVGRRGLSQCYGDSGGPVVMTIDGVETVVGVNSWQDGDDCDVPNFNTRVDVLSDWIDAQVKKFDPGFDPDAVDAPPGRRRRRRRRRREPQGRQRGRRRRRGRRSRRGRGRRDGGRLAPSQEQVRKEQAEGRHRDELRLPDVERAAR